MVRLEWCLDWNFSLNFGCLCLISVVRCQLAGDSCPGRLGIQIWNSGMLPVLLLAIMNLLCRVISATAECLLRIGPFAGRSWAVGTSRIVVLQGLSAQATRWLVALPVTAWLAEFSELGFSELGFRILAMSHRLRRTGNVLSRFRIPARRWRVLRASWQTRLQDSWRLDSRLADLVERSWGRTVVGCHGRLEPGSCG